MRSDEVPYQLTISLLFLGFIRRMCRTLPIIRTKEALCTNNQNEIIQSKWKEEQSIR